jgi:hypothetical protein
MEIVGNQECLNLRFGVTRTNPKDAPAKVVRGCESEAMALDVMLRASGAKLSYVGSRIGKSASYVCKMRTGERDIPEKLVRPLCAALDSNLLDQFRRMQRLLESPNPAEVLAAELRAAA